MRLEASVSWLVWGRRCLHKWKTYVEPVGVITQPPFTKHSRGRALHGMKCSWYHKSFKLIRSTWPWHWNSWKWFTRIYVGNYLNITQVQAFESKTHLRNFSYSIKKFGNLTLTSWRSSARWDPFFEIRQHRPLSTKHSTSLSYVYWQKRDRNARGELRISKLPSFLLVVNCELTMLSRRWGAERLEKPLDHPFELTRTVESVLKTWVPALASLMYDYASRIVDGDMHFP